MSKEIKPDMICRIVNTTTGAKNALVRTIVFDSMDGEWMCEALQHIPCQMSLNIGRLFTIINRTASPGEELSIPPFNLQPLYDGDAEDEMVRLFKYRETV